MAFNVETGDGSVSSTSYVSLEYASNYAESFFSDSAYNAWELATDSSKERALNRASKYIDRTYEFTGQRVSSTQALEFPRQYCYDCFSEEIDGVPDILQQAVCLVASKLLGNNENLDPDVDRKTIREKIDTIDITYSQDSSTLKRYVEIDNLLNQTCFVKSNRNRSVNVRLIQG